MLRPMSKLIVKSDEHDPTWNKNDGLVNTVSMGAPTSGRHGPEPNKMYDGMPIKGIWQKESLNYTVNGNLWNGSFESSFFLNLPEALEGSFIGTFNSKTKLEKLNLSLAEFEPMDNWTPIAGTINGSFEADGSINKLSSKMGLLGKLIISNLTLGSENPISRQSFPTIIY